MRTFRKFGKYFAVTLPIVLVFAFLGVMQNRVGEFLSEALPLSKMLSFCGLLVLGVLTSLVCYSTSVATFLAFWRMNDQGWKYFFRSLYLGLIIIVPLSAGIYFYEWYIGPRIAAASAERFVEVKQYGIPEEIGFEYGINLDQFVNDMPRTLPKSKVELRLDSLGAAFQAGVDTCGQMLSCLPDSFATQAYQSYALEELGVTYQFAAVPSVSQDSIKVIGGVLLYEQATRLMNTSTALQQYVILYYERIVNMIGLYLSYFLFALLGYLLRYKPLAKILGVLVVLIISVFVFRELSSYGEAYAKKVQSTLKDAASDQEDAYREIRKKAKATETTID